MASEQAKRENVSDERKVEVERDRVPKMATHFESMVDKARDEQPHHGKTLVVEAVPLRVEGIESGGARKATRAGSEERHSHRGGGGGGQRREEMHGREGGEVGKQAPSLEEISRLRATAQQNSIEAIRAAEERYEKAKQKGGGGSMAEKRTAVGGTHTGAQNAAAGKGHQEKAHTEMEAEDAARPKGGEWKDAAAEEGRQAKDAAASKGGAVIDTAAQKGRQAKDYTMEKAREAKDVTASKGGAMMDTAAEKARRAQEYTAGKASEAKDVITTKGQSASKVAAEKAKAAKDTAIDTTMTAAQKAAAAKDTTVDTTKSAVQYVGGKAAAAKDVTAESAKNAARYVGEKADATVESGKGVAAGVKDQAVVGGWGAAHYTLETAAEATKKMADVTAKVAGYTGGVAVAAKDKVVDAGQSVAGYAGEKLAAVKDTVVATEESAAEYAARKREEAKRDAEMKKSSPRMEEGGEGFISVEHWQQQGGNEGEEEEEEEEEEGLGEGEEWEQDEGERKHGIIQAIGETLVEIGQTTKDLVVGKHLLRGKHERDER